MLTQVLSTIYVAATLTSGVPEYTPAIVKAIHPYVWQDPNATQQPQVQGAPVYIQQPQPVYTQQ